MSRLITLLTDFGTQDVFVGVLKGVIKSFAPSAEVIDLTHHVSPQDIRTGAFLLKIAYQYFPPGTIHLAVVDPGVGSARRPIAARVGDFLYVCPDNGLLSYVLSEDTLTQAVVLDNEQYHHPQISRTFHGRDIFAPVAAHLANGVLLETLGTPVETVETFPLSQPSAVANTLICHVLATDVFGNVFLDLTEDMAAQHHASFATIEVSGAVISGLANSYSDVSIGEPLALFGSSGHLEIAVRNGNAREQLGIKVGDMVRIGE